MDSKGTVFVVDDDPAVCKGIRRLMDEVGLRVTTYATAREFLEDYDAASPGCLLVDVRMPGMSGMELLRSLVAQNILIPTIILTGHGHISMAVEAMRMGAVDFFEKPFNAQRLLDRVQQALAQDATDRLAKAERDEKSARFARLTPREREVVEHVAAGMANKQIAARFGVSSQAIDAHRLKAFDKLEITSVAELVRLSVSAQQVGTINHNVEISV